MNTSIKFNKTYFIPWIPPNFEKNQTKGMKHYLISFPLIKLSNKKMKRIFFKILSHFRLFGSYNRENEI